MKKEKIEVNELSTDTKVSMKTRIISAVIGVAILIPICFVGDYAFLAGILFLAVMSSIEIVKCVKPSKSRSPWLFVGTIALVCFLTFWPILRELFLSIIESSGWKVWTSFTSLYISIIVVILAIFISFFFVLIDKDTTVGDASFIFTIGMVVALGLQSLLYLRYYPIVDYYGYTAGSAMPDVSYFNFFENFQSSMLLVYVLLGTFATDIGAYFTGVFFGKHKMNETISPKKTWEGFVGGIVFSFIVSFTFAMIFAGTGNPMLSILDLDHWYFILILSLVMPVIATLGDFVFSSFKRYYGIKDFGKLIPGHGGVLDRLDSVTFSAMACALLICAFSGGGIPLL